MISKKEVKHIAKLARLYLDKKEEKKFQKELSSILDYVEKLKELDVSDVEPTSHSVALKNVVREDKVEKEDIEVVKKIRGLFPKIKDGYVKVKSVFE